MNINNPLLELVIWLLHAFCLKRKSTCISEGRDTLRSVAKAKVLPYPPVI